MTASIMAKPWATKPKTRAVPKVLDDSLWARHQKSPGHTKQWEWLFSEQQQLDWHSNLITLQSMANEWPCAPMGGFHLAHLFLKPAGGCSGVTPSKPNAAIQFLNHKPEMNLKRCLWGRSRKYNSSRRKCSTEQYWLPQGVRTKAHSHCQGRKQLGHRS